MSIPSQIGADLTKTPDQTVSDTIVALLIKEGLLRKGSESKFNSKLAGGKVTAEDWALEIELSQSSKAPGS